MLYYLPPTRHQKCKQNNLLDFHIFQNLCERRSLLKLSQVYGSNDPQENQWKVFFLNIITSDA